MGAAGAGQGVGQGAGQGAGHLLVCLKCCCGACLALQSGCWSLCCLVLFLYLRCCGGWRCLFCADQGAFGAVSRIALGIGVPAPQVLKAIWFLLVRTRLVLQVLVSAIWGALKVLSWLLALFVLQCSQKAVAGAGQGVDLGAACLRAYGC